MYAEDFLAVQQLAVTYADCVSRGDIGAAVQVYAPDGCLETPTTAPAIGRAAIEALISSTVGSLEMVFQTVHVGLIRVDGDCASARTPITEWARRERDSQPFLFLGWYEDEAIRLDEGWRFARRRLVPRTFARPDFLSGALHPATALGLEFGTS
ncbi:MAG: nuclear transport factor 2 family protein [Mycobacterium sp.]